MYACAASEKESRLLRGRSVGLFFGWCFRLVYGVVVPASVSLHLELVVVDRGGPVLGLVLLESRVQVVTAAVVDEEAPDVRLRLGADDLGYDL